jgi:hypothetical protein
MTNSKKAIAKLAVAIGLVGSLVVSAASPSLARVAAADAVSHSFHPGYTDEIPAQRTLHRTSDFNAHAEVRGLNRHGAVVDDPPGSAFQTEGNNDAMGCPC